MSTSLDCCSSTPDDTVAKLVVAVVDNVVVAVVVVAVDVAVDDVVAFDVRVASTIEMPDSK